MQHYQRVFCKSKWGSDGGGIEPASRWEGRSAGRLYVSRSLPFSLLSNWNDGVEGTQAWRRGNGALTDRGDSPVTEDEGVCRWWDNGVARKTGDSGRGSMPNCSGWRNGEGGSVCREEARTVGSSGGGYVGVVGILIGGQSGHSFQAVCIISLS